MAVEHRFCGHCGQERGEPQLSFRPAVADALADVSDLDGKLLRTFRLLLLRPGQLTVEWLEGRRVRSVSPIRLYLLASVIFFFVASLFGDAEGFVQGYSGQQQRPAQRAQLESGSLSGRITAGVARAQREPQLLGDAVLSAAPKAMFLLMPLFGLLLYLFYRKHQPLAMPHIYFSAHVHAFLFLLATLVTLVDAMRLPYVKNLLWLLILAAPVVYLFKALRLVYGESAAATVGKAVAVFFLYIPLFGAVMSLLVTFTFYSIGGGA